MEGNIDLAQIDDPMQLKALAYDQISAKEQAQNNLDKINQRLATVLGKGEQFAAALKGQDAATDEELGIEPYAPEE